MKLQRYLDRINFEGTPQVNVETLKRLHRNHLLAISYENLDVQLQRRVDLDIERIYDKLVKQRRGGWCYEMNGLLEWALKQVGFDVMRVNGGVNRAVRGDDALGNHLVLLVHLAETWVADVGFGDGVIEPIPLEGADIVQRGFHYRLEQVDDGYWRFHNHSGGGAPSFDFSAQPANEGLFAEKCEFLQTAPDSMFVTNLICQRFVDGGYETQLGRVARRITPRGVTTRILETPGELIARLHDDFGLDVPEVASLWPGVMARHEELFGSP